MPLIDKKTLWSRVKMEPRLGMLLCSGLAVLISILGHWSLELSLEASIMAGLAALMAICWVTEIVPIPVTSLFPLVLFPLFGIADLEAVGANYGKPVIFLFLGGFLLALGLQRSDVHRRIALWIIVKIGSQPARLVFGFMLATALLSMWISNTATVLVMLPIAMALLAESKQSGSDPELVKNFALALMLGIAYSADIGGMATPVGTPPNLVFLELYSKLVPGSPSIGFGQWMILGLPLSIVFLISGWFMLTHFLFRFPKSGLFSESNTIQKTKLSLGPLRRDEILTVLIFIGVALLWITGEDLQLGDWKFSGWRNLLQLEMAGDASIAIAGACLLFIIPSQDHPGETLLTWKQTSEIPWGLLLLFGGGFALAGGFQASGLSNEIGNALTGLAGIHPALLVVVVCVVITFLTEVTSNTATTTLILPILAEASDTLGINPVLLMIPATLSASCAFMMPVASPTQAIVFGSGYVPIRQMVRAGIWFNLLGIVLVTALFLLLAGPVFDARW